MSGTTTATRATNARLVIARQWKWRHLPQARLIIRFHLGVAKAARLATQKTTP